MTDRQNPPWSARSTLWLVYALFATCSIEFGLLVPAMVDQFFANLFLCAGVSTLLGSAVLLAIGAVFGAGRYWLRMPLTFCMGLGLVGCWLGALLAAMPQYFAERDYLWSEQLVALFCLPLIFLVMQSPLWIVRLFFNWRLIVASRDAPSSKAPSATIGGMLAAMAVTALALAGVRVAAWVASGINRSSATETWVWVCIIAAFMGAISTFGALPSLVATLRARRIAVGVWGLGIYSALWLALAFMLIGWAERGEPDVWLDVTLMFAMILSFMIAVAVPLLIARRFGYRLMWGRETIAGSQSGEQPVVTEDAVLLRVLDTRSSRNDDL